MYVPIYYRNPTKDQNAIEVLLETKQQSILEEKEYVDIVNYLYNEKDSTTVRVILHAEAKRIIEANTPQEDDNERIQLMNEQAREREKAEKLNRKLQYEANKIGYVRRTPPKIKVQKVVTKPQLRDCDLRLPFPVFLKTVLEFQLSTHERYLDGFKRAFRHYDENADGVLTTTEFQACFLGLRGASPSLSDPNLITWTDEEEAMFNALLADVDPNTTDRITYSNATTCLNRIGRRAAGSGTIGAK